MDIVLVLQGTERKNGEGIVITWRKI